MYDSVEAGAIPTTAELVAGYVDGHFIWTDADWARFPTARKVRIAVFAQTDDGHVLDVEQGNANPAEAPGWVLMRRKAGVNPTVYCSLSLWTTIRNQFIGQAVAEPQWWIASYDNHPAIPVGAIAKQYADDTMIGKHYDVSAVVDNWPGIDPAPYDPRKEDDMIHLVKVADDPTVWKGNRVLRTKIDSEDTLKALQWDLIHTDGYTQAQAAVRTVDDLNAFGTQFPQS
jgi:hypothetical protein